MLSGRRIPNGNGGGTGTGTGTGTSKPCRQLIVVVVVVPVLSALMATHKNSYNNNSKKDKNKFYAVATNIFATRANNFSYFNGGYRTVLKT